MRAAVIGSTGYVGVRLVPRLLWEGHEVCALVRTPDKLASTGWADAVDVVPGDLDDAEALAALMRGADVVYHLAHALEQPDFPERDRVAAEAVRDAAVAAGVSRIVYLGGLRPPDGETASRHLSSRAEVADILLDSPVPTAALEASVVVGSGSASFEMIRYLAERLPLVPAVTWVANRTQPIAIADVLFYLVACASLPDEVDRRFDLGGPDVLSYLELMRRYLRVAGLPQAATVPLPVPVPPGGPVLAAWVVDALTPLSRHLVQPLIESLAHDLVCGEEDVLTVVGVPPGGRSTYDRAVRAALGRTPDGSDPQEPFPATVSADGERSAALATPTDPAGSGGPVVRWATTVTCPAPPEHLWAAVTAVGGDHGWHTPPGVDRIGRWADQLLGGAGGYRGRPAGRALEVGDVVDGFRVEGVEARRSVGGSGGGQLRLRGETRAPGRLWLDLEVTPRGTGAFLRAEVTFATAGFGGWLFGSAVRAGAPLVVGAMASGLVGEAVRAYEREGASDAASLAPDASNAASITRLIEPEGTGA